MQVNGKGVRRLMILTLLHAVVAGVPVWMVGNEGRIATWTGWTSDGQSLAVFLSGCAVSLYLTGYAYRLTKRWFKGRKAVFWTIGLWCLPFLAILQVLAQLFQDTGAIPEGGFGAGFLIIGIVAGYPVYLLFFNVFATGVGIEEE